MSIGANIGANIRRIRRAKDITQEYLAEQIGIRQSMIASIETGAKRCTMEMGVKIAAVLGCKVTDFITEEEPHEHDHQ